MRYFRRIGSVGWFVWQARHEFTHVLIGLMYAWFLREWWQELNFSYILLAAAGSVLIDVDHLLYWFLYGKNDWLAKEVRRLIRQGQLRNVWLLIKYNHKYNTGLATHNIYFIGFFFLLSITSFQFDWKTGVVLFGATVLHLLFDVTDDLWVLGHVNDNWKRLKRKKQAASEGRLTPEISVHSSRRYKNSR